VLKKKWRSKTWKWKTFKDLIRDILAQELGEEPAEEEGEEMEAGEEGEDLVAGEPQPEDEIELEELMNELAELETEGADEEVAEEVVAEFRVDDAYFAEKLKQLEADHKSGKIGDSQYEHEKDMLYRYMNETSTNEAEVNEIDLNGDFPALAELLGVSIEAAKYLTIATGLAFPVLIGLVQRGGEAAKDIFKKMIATSKAKAAIAKGSTQDTVAATTEESVSEELAEALETIETLRNDLNETNLLNAKLLYVNKVFKANNLTESQKANVIATFDKAETVKEVKLVFESVSANITAAGKKEVVKEAKGFASAAVGLSTKPEVITEANEVVKRMQKLAGIIK
jgi:hypothetical protein